MYLAYERANDISGMPEVSTRKKAEPKLREEHLEAIYKPIYSHRTRIIASLVLFFELDMCAFRPLSNGKLRSLVLRKGVYDLLQDGPNAPIFIDPIEKGSPFCPRVGRYDHCAPKVGLPLGFVMESHGLRDDSTTAERMVRKPTVSFTRKKVI